MMDARYDLVAIGRPYTDFIVMLPDDRLLEAFGFRKGKIREITPYQMTALRGEITDYTMYPGGSPPNTCAVVQALGGQAAFIGKVCNDHGGRVFRDAFTKSGVHFPTADHPDAPGAVSGTCVVLETPDEVATVVNCPGVGDVLTVADMAPDVIANSKLLYLQAHFLFAPTAQEAVRHAVALARGAKRQIAYSLHDHRMTPEQATIFIGQDFQDGDMAIGNREEFEQIFRPLDLDKAEDERRLLIMTDGAQGAYIIGQNRSHHVLPHKLKSKDNTVGAGDALAGGFFYGYGKGLPLEECGEMGSEAASAILEVHGARPTGSWTHIAEGYLHRAPSMLRPSLSLQDTPSKT